MSKKITVALAGNPNSGKTSLFNILTGARQHVGNYPGVTVEKKEGTCRFGDTEMTIVDLPGTYSLTAYSVEELVARHFLIENKPDVVVDIIDASNLERNLYLAVQLMELNVPLVLAFNMSDVAKARGFKFDLEFLSKLTGTPIIQTVGHKGIGKDELLEAVLKVAGHHQPDEHSRIHYGSEIENELGPLQEMLEKDQKLTEKYDSRWLAVKLLESDEEIRKQVISPEVLARAKKSTAHLEHVVGDSPEVLIADRRYGFISGACQEAVRSTVETRHTVSDKIDAVITNRILALPIFAILMYLVFQLTFTVGNPCVDFLDGLICEDLPQLVSQVWTKDSDSLVKSLVVDGIIGGVGAVLVFVPLILLLFLAIAILEDTGYMARAAFIMDRLMHKIGLHGKSFVPMLIGFGCTVPAIMATRTLENHRDRMTTMLVAPLMSCSARIPIYMLFIPVFFPAHWHTPILWCIYTIGIVLAIVSAKLLRATVFKGESTPFVMELPPYRMPTLRGLFIHMWDRTWLYIKKAGTIIFALAVILWAANTFPQKTGFDINYEQEAQQATSVFVKDVEKLKINLSLPAGSTLPADAVSAELKMAQEQEKYWENQDGYKKAQQKKDAAIAKLIKADGGKILSAFLEMRDRIVALRDQFESAVEEGELDEDSPEYSKLEKARNDKIAKAGKSNPKIFRVVIMYLDNIKKPFDEKLQDIDARKGSETMAHAVSGRVGRAMVPVLKPLGFDNWRIGTALIGSFAAKEVFVSQMGIVYSLGEDVDEKSQPLREKLRGDYTALQAFCIMLFCLISAPCLATIAVTKRESNSWKWALFQLGGLTVMAYVITLAVFQIGNWVL